MLPPTAVAKPLTDAELWAVGACSIRPHRDRVMVTPFAVVRPLRSAMYVQSACWDCIQRCGAVERHRNQYDDVVMPLIPPSSPPPPVPDEG